MRVIVVGVGRVGAAIARFLARDGHVVTVVDQDPDIAEQLAADLDVRSVVGLGSLPDVLDRAGGREADAIIATTHNDEVNIVACEVAGGLFETQIKIARIRNASYLNPAFSDLFSRQHIAIDAVFSPEVDIARALARHQETPGPSFIAPFCAGAARAFGLDVGPTSPLVGAEAGGVFQLFPGLNAKIVAVERSEKIFAIAPGDVIRSGDRVYCVSAAKDVERILTAFSQRSLRNRRILIDGAGRVGMELARLLEADPNVTITMIERNAQRAQAAAEGLRKTIVLNGDATDAAILAQADVERTDIVFAVTDNDHINIFAGFHAKRLGAKMAVILAASGLAEPAKEALGLDIIVSTQDVMVSRLSPHFRKGRILAVRQIGPEPGGEIIEAVISPTSHLADKPMRDDALPDGVVIGLVQRGATIFAPQNGERFAAGDHVLLFAEQPKIKAVERMFRVSLEYLGG
ncbi:MAG TPA: Trk system potassium transporter TrkA [Hyphomonadaceae bacterium]|nr:Trk system potassium transporter TrkA [Hyphomonadaceae bacterium]